jgi:LPPG:FO 2-phospho-L-lactate transferase
VVGVSPIIGGGAVRGMADQLLTGLGVELSATGVAAHHTSRRRGGILDGWLIDSADEDQVERIASIDIECRAVPLWMTDAPLTDQLALDTIALAVSTGDAR